MEGSDRAARRDAQPEYFVAWWGEKAVPVPGLLDDPDPGLRSEEDQHPGTDVALPWRIKYQYNQHTSFLTSYIE